MSDVRTISELQKDVEILKTNETPTYGASLFSSIVWGGGGTPPVVNNGTLEAHYIQVGKLVTLSIYLLWGSSTTGGNGAWTFTLPFTASATKGSAVGLAWILDAGTRLYNGSAMINNGETTLAVYDVSTNADASHPHTWAVNDILKITITYEAA